MNVVQAKKYCVLDDAAESLVKTAIYNNRLKCYNLYYIFKKQRVEK